MSLLKKIPFFFICILIGCSQTVEPIAQNEQGTVIEQFDDNISTETNYEDSDYAVATLAGGCFWCTEAFFQEEEGVLDVVSGFAGGHKENPSYREVVNGQTRYAESVQILYDPDIIGYEEILEIFWETVDPTDATGQFVDRGLHYRTIIFYHDEAQYTQAARSKKELDLSGLFDKPIVTEIKPYKNFYLAEEYHQDFYLKSSARYNQYKKGSGRENFYEEMYGAE